jgi:hypothetical protein
VQQNNNLLVLNGGERRDGIGDWGLEMDCAVVVGMAMETGGRGEGA